MNDLSALTPPLLMGAVVVFAIVAFLRHEMRRSESGREDQAADISPAEQFGDPDLDSPADAQGTSSSSDGS